MNFQCFVYYAESAARDEFSLSDEWFDKSSIVTVLFLGAYSFIVIPELLPPKVFKVQPKPYLTSVTCGFLMGWNVVSLKPDFIVAVLLSDGMSSGFAKQSLDNEDQLED